MRHALVLAVAWVLVAASGDGARVAGFLVANDDTSVPFPPNTVSFYPIGAEGGLGRPVRASTQGNGVAGGYFGIDRVILAGGPGQDCVFASNAQSESIAGFDANTHALIGVFHGSQQDSELAAGGIGLAAAGGRLYATFSGARTLAAFRIGAGCRLRFLGDVAIGGLAGGTAQGVAVRGRMMVAAYGDGSTESFDVSGDLPVPHDDARFSARPDEDFLPAAVAITSDGRFAIFGGASTQARVQVAELSAGRLGATATYALGSAWNSGGIRLSPDESVLYVSNSSGGRITAAFFDKAGGRLRPGCVSAELHGFYSSFTHVGTVATQLQGGTGGLIYVPEFSAAGASSIGILRFSASGKGCSLTEVTGSPVAAGGSVLSVAVVPGRLF